MSGVEGVASLTPPLSTSFLRVSFSELPRESRNIMAILLNLIYHPGSSANELSLKAKDDEFWGLVEVNGL